MKKALVRLALWAVLEAVVMTGSAPRGFAGTLVSAGFINSCYNGSYSGVEPLANAANPAAFGAANHWDPLTLGCLSPLSSPSFSNLADSTGNPTSIGLQFTGSVDSSHCGPPACAHGIFSDFIYINGGVLDWQLTGLAPGVTAYLYFYGYGDEGQNSRTFGMDVDTN